MIQGNVLRDALISASRKLMTEKQAVDALNIFPVPDGDTGTNMSMTLSAAARVLEKSKNQTVSEVAEQAASAMLRGARGNSGVILSLLFRGFSKGLRGKKQCNGAEAAAALTLGVEAAYKAVMKPTEGTILTVSREAAEAGRAKAEETQEILPVWQAMCLAAEESLERTPDLLPVLKKTGVVDAGGKGLCIILRAMENVFAGGEMEADTQPRTETAAAVGASAAGTFETDIRFTYCTEFIVGRDKNCTADPLRLRAYLESIGDCVVVVDDEEIIKVHVHTNDPGKALSKAIEYGQFETVKVENMRIQHQNAGWVDQAIGPESGAQVPQYTAPEEPYGFVAVAAGEGLQALFGELGCGQVVSGGQTMNPSTDDILRAVEAVPAKVVYVLPNNKNIILAAEQAIPLADREVHVLQTCTVPQGVAALLAFDPDAQVEENLTAMMQAAENVSTGSLTFAARDSDFEGRSIKEGQLLALAGSKLLFTDEEMTHACIKLVRELISARRRAGRTSGVMTLIYGNGVSREEAEAVGEAVRAKYGDLDVTVVDGGQPVYYYFISLE
ncbi:MAG: DAK2 domain-containing protein [Clostridia bacterium]|nr:DAK2 domain-containing protein [Clostridia bacterium]